MAVVRFGTTGVQCGGVVWRKWLTPPRDAHSGAAALQLANSGHVTPPEVKIGHTPPPRQLVRVHDRGGLRAGRGVQGLYHRGPAGGDEGDVVWQDELTHEPPPPVRIVGFRSLIRSGPARDPHGIRSGPARDPLVKGSARRSHGSARRAHAARVALAGIGIRSRDPNESRSERAGIRKSRDPNESRSEGAGIRRIRDPKESGSEGVGIRKSRDPP